MKTLIDLLLESELAEMNDKETVDEIGKFFIVKKPKKGMTKEDIMCEATVFDNLDKDEIKGVTNKNQMLLELLLKLLSNMRV